MAQSNSSTVYHPPLIPMAVSDSGVTATPVSFTASASTDVYAITADGDGNTIITKNGTTIEDEATANILALSITGGAAEVSINFTNGDPLPVGGLYSDAAIVELDGPHGSDELVTTSTAAYIGSDEIRYSANTITIGDLFIVGASDLRQEPGAVVPLAGIGAGGGGQPPSLPRQLVFA